MQAPGGFPLLGYFMKIIALETLRLDEFFNLLLVRVHTDTGLVGLGETFYGARSRSSYSRHA